jgi:hypothetical protein
MLAPRDLNEQVWSQTPTILSRQGFNFIYDNYTIGNDTNGSATRWTRRRKRVDTPLIRRGFGIDEQHFLPTGSWRQNLPLRRARDGYGYHPIRLCFEDHITRDRLRGILCEV